MGDSMTHRSLLFPVLMMLAGCGGPGGGVSDSGADTDTGTGADADTDADTDTDTNTDTETGSDTDTSGDTDTNPDLGGHLIWAKKAGGTESDSASGLATMADGASFVTGKFGDNIAFGVGEANQTEFEFSSINSHMYVARYDPDGLFDWARVTQEPWSSQYSSGAAALPDGSAIAVGNFSGSVTFGAGESNETTLTSVADTDILIVKYNPDGTLAWARSAGGESVDTCSDISSLSDGSFYVTGYFCHDIFFDLGEPNEVGLEANGYQEIYLARYDADGNVEWATSAVAGPSGAMNLGCSVAAVEADGSVIVTGRFEHGITFGPGEANETEIMTTGFDDIFVARYNADGTLAWATNAGGTLDDIGTEVAVLPDGSSLLTGNFALSAVFGAGEPNETTLDSAGETDMFVARYAPDGTLVWAKRGGSVERDGGTGIAVLPSGVVLASGWFDETATYGQGEANETGLISRGSTDVMIAKYAADGSLVWAKSAGSLSTDYSHEVSLLADGTGIMTGKFKSTALFGQGEENQTYLHFSGEYDIFLAKFEP